MTSYYETKSKLEGLTNATLADLWNSYCGNSEDEIIYIAGTGRWTTRGAVWGAGINISDIDDTVHVDDINDIYNAEHVSDIIETYDLAEYFVENPDIAAEYDIELIVEDDDRNQLFKYVDDTDDVVVKRAAEITTEYAKLPQADEYPLQWRLVCESQRRGDAWQENLGTFDTHADALEALKNVKVYNNDIDDLNRGYAVNHVIYLADSEAYDDMPQELAEFIDKHTDEFGLRGWTVKMYW